MESLVEYVQNLWPFSKLVYDDLRTSDSIVKKMPIPESTKHFVYAIKEPESNSVIYVLAVQNLSERAALDAECLISQVKPDAVVVQVGRVNDTDLCDFLRGSTELTAENRSVLLDSECAVPTSSFEVLRQCFVNKMNRDKYEEMAGSLVLREIFGVTFNEHFLVAKRAAEKVGSSFLMIEAPIVKDCTNGESSDAESEDASVGNRFLNVFNFQLNRLHDTGSNSLVYVDTRAAFSFKEAAIQSQLIKPLRSYLVGMDLVRKSRSELVRPLVDYEAPEYARGVYPLLVDLHNIFADIPSMGTALACAQKMLSTVNAGEKVDTELVSEVYAFQIAVEGLRIALTNAGRFKMGKARNTHDCEFDELPVEDKSHAIFARALRTQAKNYRSIVAVVDASGLAGLRKHWNTTLPLEVDKMVEQIVTNVGGDCESSTSGNRKRLLSDKPVVAVGAGASAIIGVSSLSKALPASSFVKIATFHVPSSLKLILTQTQKVILYAFGKGLGPTKIMAPGMASSTLKTSAFKAAASAEKIRLVTHSMIASAEKTSFSAMRAAFYEIMRKRQVRPVGVLPWATFGCSVATMGSLLMYGDGIECAAESCPVAPSIASLGRGIENLHQVSQAVKQVESSRIQKSIELLLYKFKNIKIQ